MNPAVTQRELAAKIDHTLLKPEAAVRDIEDLCRQAAEHRFASVCVNSCHVPLCAALLEGTGVPVCAVVGFPLGAMSSAAKAFEAREAVAGGAREIDMVINIGLLKSGRHDEVRADIRAVADAAAPALVKVIIETCLLTEDEKRVACALSREAGAAFVKTSTGFGRAGASAEDVRLMKEASGGLRVKASGGIRTTADALAMLEAGADRLGCSASVAIVGGLAD